MITGRSIVQFILFANPAQKAAAEQSRDAAAKNVSRSHHDGNRPADEVLGGGGISSRTISRRNPNAGYCAAVIAPKIRKLEHKLEAEKK